MLTGIDRTMNEFMSRVNLAMPCRSWRSVLAVMLATLLCTACATPWVKPYERQNLAEVVMQFERDEVAADYLAHAYGAREGARGAEGGSGGGCGCN